MQELLRPVVVGRDQEWQELRRALDRLAEAQRTAQAYGDHSYGAQYVIALPRARGHLVRCERRDGLRLAQ